MKAHKICKKHGELDQKDIVVFITRGYVCKRCRFCIRENDKKARMSKNGREWQKKYRSTPEWKEKKKQQAERYKERRAIVGKILYDKKKMILNL